MYRSAGRACTAGSGPHAARPTWSARGRGRSADGATPASEGGVFVVDATKRSMTKRAALLEAKRLYSVVVLGRVLGVDAIGEALDEAQQRGVRAHVGGAVGGVVEVDLGELGDL